MRPCRPLHAGLCLPVTCMIIHEPAHCRFDAGAKPDFLVETRGIREGDWKVSLSSSLAVAMLARKLMNCCWLLQQGIMRLHAKGCVQTGFLASSVYRCSRHPLIVTCMSAATSGRHAAYSHTSGLPPAPQMMSPYLHCPHSLMHCRVQEPPQPHPGKCANATG